MKQEKTKEREILLKRFFFNDRRLYHLGRAMGIIWFEQFDQKFTKDEYAFFSPEEKIEAIQRLVDPKLDDKKFISALNKVGPPDYMTIDKFVGRYYYFDAKEDAVFKLEDKRKEVSKQVKQALRDTGKRGYYLLKAIIELYKEKKQDKAYGGVTWIDILSKVRELGGIYPAPRDIPILKSYRIYYKTGSRRYPTHTIPEEMIITIEKVLDSAKEKES